MTALPPGRVSAAALLTLPWCLVVAVLAVIRPASPAEWQAADPILNVLPHAVTTWGVPLLGLVVAGLWFRRARPSAADMRWSLIRAAAGVVSAGLIVGAVRWFAGPTPPPFTPTEETAAPGWLLGMTAGVGEELVFRLLLVPFLFWALEKKLPKMPAIFLTALITGLVLTGTHALAPDLLVGGSPPVWHLSRLLLPGMLMSFAFLRLGPSFLVTAHCAAHIWLPVIFAGG